MTEEEKQILIIDLCARSIYGVMCDRLGQAKKLLSVSPDKLYCIELDNCEYTPNKYKVEDVKPYLRPLSSMTEEEKECIKYRWCYDNWTDIHDFLNNYKIDAVDAHYFIDWLNKYHFDYRGLIEKGLALEAPEGMYKN